MINKIIRTYLLFFFIASITSTVKASHNTNDNKFNAGELIIDHIIDAYQWHIATIGNYHLTINLPIILYYDNKFYTFCSSKLENGKIYKSFKLETKGENKGKIVKICDNNLIEVPINLSITKNVYHYSLYLCYYA